MYLDCCILCDTVRGKCTGCKMKFKAGSLFSGVFSQVSLTALSACRKDTHKSSPRRVFGFELPTQKKKKQNGTTPHTFPPSPGTTPHHPTPKPPPPRFHLGVGSQGIGQPAPGKLHLHRLALPRLHLGASRPPRARGRAPPPLVPPPLCGSGKKQKGPNGAIKKVW